MSAQRANSHPTTGLAKQGLRPPIWMSTRLDRWLTRIGSHLVLVLFTAFVLYPLIWMVLTSLKTTRDMMANVWGFPRTLVWENYVTAWVGARLDYALRNSVIVSVSTVVLVTCMAGLAGYAFARLRFRFATPIFLLFIFTMNAPDNIIPLYVMLSKMHLTDNLLGLVLVLAARGLPLSIFIFRAYFQSIPHELLDAAKVDGCSELSAFMRVVVPVSTPAVVTVAVLELVGSWNEFMLALILLHSPAVQTIPIAIQSFFMDYQTSWQPVFAALTIGSIPVIALYVIMQRQFIQGLTSGAIKG